MIKYGSIIDVESDDIPSIAQGKESKGTPYLRDGDVIIADTAEDEAVGKCCEIINVNDAKVESGLHTIPCRPLASFVPMFLGYYMNSQYYHKQLFPLMQGVKVLSISKSNIGKTHLSAPSSHFEQKKIVEIFDISTSPLVAPYNATIKSPLETNLADEYFKPSSVKKSSVLSLWISPERINGIVPP